MKGIYFAIGLLVGINIILIALLLGNGVPGGYSQNPPGPYPGNPNPKENPVDPTGSDPGSTGTQTGSTPGAGSWVLKGVAGPQPMQDYSMMQAAGEQYFVGVASSENNKHDIIWVFHVRPGAKWPSAEIYKIKEPDMRRYLSHRATLSLYLINSRKELQLLAVRETAGDDFMVEYQGTPAGGPGKAEGNPRIVGKEGWFGKDAWFNVIKSYIQKTEEAEKGK